MIFRWFGCLLLACLVLPISAQAGGPQPKNEPKNEPKEPAEWFARAEEQMNLRIPGSSPFHIKVVFHAYAGIELLKKPQIITGDGIYEETWLSAQQWRQEVTLGSYHAIEVQSGRVRKIEVSSDYEPSRVLMLLQALVEPVPRNLVSPVLDDIPVGWAIEQKSAGKIHYVRLVRTWTTIHNHTFAYVFLPNGLLVQSDEAGLVTNWQDQTVFAGKVVPRHFAVQAMGNDLLTAEVTVEAASKPDPAIFDLPGGPAEPGMTLKPLHMFQVKGLDLSSSFAYIGNTSSARVLRQVIDRQGNVRETELISAPDMDFVEPVMNGFRRVRSSPPTIDESPCELVWHLYL